MFGFGGLFSFSLFVWLMFVWLKFILEKREAFARYHYYSSIFLVRSLQTFKFVDTPKEFTIAGTLS